MANVPPIIDYPGLQRGAQPYQGTDGPFPVVSATNASGQSIPSGTATVVTGWDVTAPGENVGGPPATVAPVTAPCFDPAAGIFTAPQDGTYEIDAQLQYVASVPAPGNEYRVEVWRAAWNPTTQVLGAPGPVAEGASIAETAANVKRTATVSRTLLLGRGDQIAIRAFQDQGGPVLLAASALVNFLSIRQAA